MSLLKMTIKSETRLEHSYMKKKIQSTTFEFICGPIYLKIITLLCLNQKREKFHTISHTHTYTHTHTHTHTHIYIYIYIIVFTIIGGGVTIACWQTCWIAASQRTTSNSRHVNVFNF